MILEGSQSVTDFLGRFSLLRQLHKALRKALDNLDCKKTLGVAKKSKIYNFPSPEVTGRTECSDDERSLKKMLESSDSDD